jgi:hypothetical protein
MGLAPSGNGENPGKSAVAKVPVPIFSQPRCVATPLRKTDVFIRKLLKANLDAAEWRWQVMRRNPVAYVRGKISHPDHATIRLDGWHRVAMNTESQSSSVAFLD